jgi:hypothetical protein
MRDEVLGALGDPGQLAPAELPTLAQSDRQRESCRVRERPRPLGGFVSSPRTEPTTAYLLRPRQVHTQQITPLILHNFILT